MSKADCDIRIGTSGWYYDHWKELFYPAKLPKSKWFEHYAQHFDSVEINNTFYRVPARRTRDDWVRRVEGNPGLLFTAKAPRDFTHRQVPAADHEIREFKTAIEPIYEM